MLASSTLHFPHYHISHIFTSYHISSLVVIGGQVFSWVILMAYIWYTKYSWVPNANMRWAQSTILSLEIQSPLLMEGGGGGTYVSCGDMTIPNRDNFAWPSGIPWLHVPHWRINQEERMDDWGWRIMDITPYGIWIKVYNMWRRITKINRMQNGRHMMAHVTMAHPKPMASFSYDVDWWWKYASLSKASRVLTQAREWRGWVDGPSVMGKGQPIKYMEISKSSTSQYAETKAHLFVNAWATNKRNSNITHGTSNTLNTLWLKPL